jgi:hypothetical protein
VFEFGPQLFKSLAQLVVIHRQPPFRDGSCRAPARRTGAAPISQMILQYTGSYRI